MPIKWSCPGYPKCLKTFQYAQGLKAHMDACKHAKAKEVAKKRSEVETMLTIIQFVEDQQKGNVTISRKRVNSYRRDSVHMERI